MKYDKMKSAYADYPGYRVDLVPQTERVRVYHGDTLIADSLAGGLRTDVLGLTGCREPVG